MPELLPCILCQTLPLKDKFTILHGALECRAHGNYGSTVYDPMDNRTYLTFNICDNCIKTLGDRGFIREVTRLPQPDKLTYKKWAYGDFSDD